jgi:hypothetical protein
MIDCVFIQTNESTLEGHEFICTSKMVFSTSTEFKHPNFGIKKGTISLVFFLFFKYCYVAKILTKLLAKKMKRRKSLESKSNGNQVPLEFDCEEKKRENGCDFFR